MPLDPAYGVHTTDPAAAARTYPGITCDRVFIPRVLTPATHDLAALHDKASRRVYDAGLAPITSFKLAPPDVLSGRWDDALAAYAQHLADRPRTWVAYYHEPENDMDGETYAASFAAVREAMKRGWEGVQLGYIAMAYQWRPGIRGGATRDPKPWASVDADWYGIDVYSGSTEPLAAFWHHPGASRWFAEVMAPRRDGAPWAITERGFTRGRDAARSIVVRREANNLDVWGTLPFAVIYWNTTGSEDNADLVNGPMTERVLRQIVRLRWCSACNGTGRIPR